MEFDNIETIKQAVEIGAGISILPEPPIREACRNGSLVAVRLIAPELHRPIGIIHRQRKVFTPTAAKFVELLKRSSCRTGGMHRTAGPWHGAPRAGSHLRRSHEVRRSFRSRSSRATRRSTCWRGPGCKRRPRRPIWCSTRPVAARARAASAAWSSAKAPRRPRPKNATCSAEEELHAGCRLACQATVDGPMSVLVPATSLVDRPHQILVHSEAAGGRRDGAAGDLQTVCRTSPARSRTTTCRTWPGCNAASARSRPI